MRRMCLIVLGAFYAITALSTNVFSAQYKMVDLGVSPGGLSSFAYAINDIGQVVIHSDVPHAYHAFLLQDGTMADLGTLDGAFSSGAGINNSGQVVGYSYVDATYRHPVIWRDGEIIDLGGEGEGVANAINDAGQVVGWYDELPLDYSHAMLWNGSTTVDLGTLGGSWSNATAINNLGCIVGGASLSNGRTHACLWVNGAATDLGTLGGNHSFCTGINDSNQIVGYSRTTGSDYSRHAFYWADGSLVDLGTLGGTESFAYGINQHGTVVGYSYLSNNSKHAFVWEGSKLVDLGTLGGKNSFACAINSWGQIVGYSETVQGYNHAVMWVPVPEPSSILALLCGIVGMGGVCLRRRSAQ